MPFPTVDPNLIVGVLFPIITAAGIAVAGYKINQIESGEAWSDGKFYITEAFAIGIGLFNYYTNGTLISSGDLLQQLIAYTGAITLVYKGSQLLFRKAANSPSVLQALAGLTPTAASAVIAVNSASPTTIAVPTAGPDNSGFVPGKSSFVQTPAMLEWEKAHFGNERTVIDGWEIRGLKMTDEVLEVNTHDLPPEAKASFTAQVKANEALGNRRYLVTIGNVQYLIEDGECIGTT